MTPKERHETGMTVFSMLMDFLLKLASLFHKKDSSTSSEQVDDLKED